MNSSSSNPSSSNNFHIGGDPYVILNIKKDCSEEDIRKAYCCLAKEWHPDRNGNPDAADNFRVINWAYEFLTNPEVRNCYNNNAEFFKNKMEHLHQVMSRLDEISKVRMPCTTPCEDLKNLLNMAQAPTNFHLYPSNEIELHCTLEDIYNSITKEFQVVREVLTQCKNFTHKVKSRGSIPVSPFYRDGTLITLRGQGNENLDGSTSDLLIKIKILPHPNFKLVGDDIHTTCNISLAEAFTGCHVNIPFLNGQNLRYDFTTQITPKTKIRVPNLGLPKGNSDSCGDLIFDFDITFPRNLSLETRRLIGDLCMGG